MDAVLCTVEKTVPSRNKASVPRSLGSCGGRYIENITLALGLSRRWDAFVGHSGAQMGIGASGRVQAIRTVTE